MKKIFFLSICIFLGSCGGTSEVLENESVISSVEKNTTEQKIGANQKEAFKDSVVDIKVTNDDSNIKSHDGSQIIEGQLIVITDGEISRLDVENVVRDYDMKVVGEIPMSHTYQVEGELSSYELERVKEALLENENILSVSFNKYNEEY